MKDVFVGITILAVVSGVIYGTYWIGKTVSYSIFYEDMVLQSIKTTVKKSCLLN